MLTIWDVLKSLVVSSVGNITMKPHHNMAAIHHELHLLRRSIRSYVTPEAAYCIQVLCSHIR